MDREQIHLFHYTGYSAVWSIRAVYGSHPHAQRTRGHDHEYLTREYRIFTTSAEAEAHVGDILETHNAESYDDDPHHDRIELIRHAPANTKRTAVRVKTTDPDNGSTRNAWLIYGPNGQRERVIYDPTNGKMIFDLTQRATLDRLGVSTILPEPLELTPREFVDLDAPF